MLEMIIEYHNDNDRQGPGSEEATLHALSCIPEPKETSEILDIGCGTGGQYHSYEFYIAWCDRQA